MKNMIVRGLLILVCLLIMVGGILTAVFADLETGVAYIFAGGILAMATKWLAK